MSFASKRLSSGAGSSQVYNVELMIGQCAHIFNTGHRVGLTITSSNFPRFQANPNTGLPIEEETAWPTYPAAQSVYLGAGGHATALHLPTVGLREVPPA